MNEPDTILRTAFIQWVHELTPQARQDIITEINTTPTERN